MDDVSSYRVLLEMIAIRRVRATVRLERTQRDINSYIYKYDIPSITYKEGPQYSMRISFRALCPAFRPGVMKRIHRKSLVHILSLVTPYQGKVTR